ncbi:MAG: hypothetical protein J0M08_13020, partial [Bacteroidetes bacterium]|nr:hypothetical protein [Bacteroidota bacterium]
MFDIVYICAMLAFSNCKINLGLNVVEKRADGFHNIESVFLPIQLADVVEIIDHTDFSLSVSGLAIDGDVHLGRVGLPAGGAGNDDG